MNQSRVESPLVSSLLIVALTVLGLGIARIVGKRIAKSIQAMKHLRETRRQQILTLIGILRWGVDISIVIVALMMLLSTFGVDITPLMASVGVAGLAVSLGAQSLIKDFFSGFFILIENQYVVGDSIQVGDVSGQVERFTLRATYVRDINGSLHIVPNGEVRIVSNATRDWSRALINVGVAYEEDVDRTLRVLESVAEAFGQDPEFESQLLESPQVIGPQSLENWIWTVQVAVKTQPGKHWEVARELRKHILAACDQEGIVLPYPRQEVWVHSAMQNDSKTSGSFVLSIAITL